MLASVKQSDNMAINSTSLVGRYIVAMFSGHSASVIICMVLGSNFAFDQ